MTNLTRSPDFLVRTMSPSEWHARATGNLALPPGFWEGPGKDLRAQGVTAYGAFLRERGAPAGAQQDRLLGYIGVRAVALEQISQDTRTALEELLVARRMPSAMSLSPTSQAAIEKRPDVPADQTVAYNLDFALVGERGRGVGTALAEAALAHVGQQATPETPMPAYLSVAAQNPATRLWTRAGFEPLTLSGMPYTKDNPYYQPPDASGNFAPPVTTQHIFMGTVVEGPAAVL